MYVCMYVCMCVCVCVCVCMWNKGFYGTRTCLDCCSTFSVCLSVYLSIHPYCCSMFSVCLFIYPSIHPSLYLSIYLSVCLSVCLCVCVCGGGGGTPITKAPCCYPVVHVNALFLLSIIAQLDQLAFSSLSALLWPARFLSIQTSQNGT